MASRSPPLAGKPPFATDEPDTFYESSPTPQRRVRQNPPPNPNSRSSAYNVYDNYLDGSNRNSGVGALGMGFLNGELSDDDDDDTPSQPTKPATTAHPQPHLPQQHHPEGSIPVIAPRPGYAAPIAALNLSHPLPVAKPQDRQVRQPPSYGSPSPISVPSTPHPLQAPMTPITPAFARPPKSGLGIKFAASSKPIMRSNTEETLLPKRGERGDDFWRRFSMIAKEPTAHKESTWLRKTQNGTSRLTRWVWIVGCLLLICIAGAIGIGWYVSHKAPPNQQPTAFGGSADELASSTSSSTLSTTHSGTSAASTYLHVSPTNTVARRVAVDPSPTGSLYVVRAYDNYRRDLNLRSPISFHNRYGLTNRSRH